MDRRPRQSPGWTRLRNQWFFSRLCAARTCRVVDREALRRTVHGYRVVCRLEARIFVLADGEGSIVRSIACVDDGGRWTFETGGEPLRVEAGFDHALVDELLVEGITHGPRHGQLVEAVLRPFPRPVAATGSRTARQRIEVWCEAGDSPPARQEGR